jgi:hypothetical protein
MHASAVEAPCVVENVPALQSKQVEKEDAPEAEEYLPASHKTQTPGELRALAVLPHPSRNCPEAHMISIDGHDPGGASSNAHIPDAQS